MTTTDPRASAEQAPEHQRYEIPESEKLAAQWEARHDLAAGRRSTDPTHVQHSLAQKRSEEALREAEHPSHVRVVPKQRTPEPAEPAAHGDSDHGWRRWFRHAS